MAEVTIKIKDLDNGKVSVQAEPNFMTMAMMDESGHGLTAAHGYALAMLREVRKISKSNESNILVQIPRLGK
jgi:hypothetical protein